MVGLNPHAFARGSISAQIYLFCQRVDRSVAYFVKKWELAVKSNFNSLKLDFTASSYFLQNRRLTGQRVDKIDYSSTIFVICISVILHALLKAMQGLIIVILLKAI